MVSQTTHIAVSQLHTKFTTAL